MEDILSFKFDNYYKNFLKLNNGGIPQNDIFDIVNLNNIKDEYEFFSFNCLIGNKDSDTIEDYTKRYQEEKRILNNFIVVGMESGGSLILLNKDDNKIYFWDRDFEVSEGEEPSMENCYLIADSFQEFFEEKLYEYIDEED